MAELSEEVDKAREVLSDPRTLVVGDGCFILMGQRFEFSPLVLDVYRTETVMRIKHALDLPKRPWWKFWSVG